MINDPYSILEISKNATNDEVKKAYRDMSRKYHPDSYAGNPLSELAEEKFKEVQEAYNQIMQERESGYSSGGTSGSWQQSASQSSSQDLTNVYNSINGRRYQEALNLLYRIPGRDGQWYYLSAAANAGLGNNIQAQNDARQAVNLEPNNAQYRQLLNQLQWSGQRYQGTQRSSGMPSTGNCCCDLWIADSCCECMGGDLCSCM